MPTRHPPTLPAIDTIPRDDIRVIEITPTEWAIRNARFDSADARSLIGFIEHVGTRYEVMTFGDPVRYAQFSSLDGAVISFTRQRRARFPLLRRRFHSRAVGDEG